MVGRPTFTSDPRPVVSYGGQAAFAHSCPAPRVSYGRQAARRRTSPLHSQTMGAAKKTMVSTRRIFGAAMLALACGMSRRRITSHFSGRDHPLPRKCKQAGGPGIRRRRVRAQLNGSRMECTFQQVFLTTSAIVPETCLITTNRSRDLRPRSRLCKSMGEPRGPRRGLRHRRRRHLARHRQRSMDAGNAQGRHEADGAATCGAMETGPETLSGQNIRRPLPCRFVQPGGLVF